MGESSFALELSHDQIIALAQVIEAWYLSLTLGEIDITLLYHVLTLAKKLPDEEFLDAMSPPEGEKRNMDVEIADFFRELGLKRVSLVFQQDGLQA